MKIPQEKIEEVRLASDIVDVISAYVRLKRRGKSYVGLCPFHQEKTPSFHVAPDKQMYYCFGCQEGGNVFTFVMKTENVSFAEAVRSLAQQAGIEIPTADTSRSGSTENERLFRANMVAARFFRESLFGTSEGEFALRYFSQRGFTDEAIKKFGLGYAPRSWQALMQHASALGIEAQYLEKAGLVVKRDDGGYYDRFRGRAMFPILSTTGRVVGFAGRQLYSDDTLPKYINSPETSIYQKSKVLYGLSLTRDAIRKSEYAILVEGYTDLISIYMADIQNVVASSGTALTEDQVRLLGRYASAVVIMYDADSAGSNAALRGVDLLLEKGLDVRIAQLPHGEDPDSYVRTYGRDAFLGLIDESVSVIDFKANMLRSEGYFNTPEGQAKAIRSIIRTLAKIPDELKRNLYIKAIAERYDLYESVLYRELDTVTREDRRRGEPLPERRPVVSKPSATGNETVRKNPDLHTFATAERDIIKLILQSDRDVLEFIFSQVTSDELHDTGARELYDRLQDYYKQNGAIQMNTILNDDLFSQFSRVITSILAQRYEVSSRWHELRGFEEFPVNMQLAIDAVRTLKKRNVKDRIESVRKQMRESEREGGDSIRFARDLQILQKELKLIDEYFDRALRR